MAVFTVDWEDYQHALHFDAESKIHGPTMFLLDLLVKYEVKATFYILGRCHLANLDSYREIKDRNHNIAWHGFYHDRKERNVMPEMDFRSPYWSGTPMPMPPSGGFFFRFMPFWYVKWAVEKSGVFWIHPHDLMEDHPQLKNPFLNWKRHVGLNGARAKLDRLLSEVKWDDPTKRD